jgi:hypothetical protein
MQSIHALKQLYELDDSQWLGETISLLRNHQFQQLDWEHLTCAMSINAYSSQKLENLEPDHKEK